MKTCLLAGLLLLITRSATAVDMPSDFAYALPIDGVGTDALYRIVITPEVYEGSAFPDLRDLRVFNGNGEVVPHSFRPVAKVVHQAKAVKLPFFELRGPNGTHPDDLDIVVDSANTKFRLRATSGNQQNSEAALLGYLVDVSATKERYSELRLNWEDSSGDYVSAINVEAGDDLKRWTRIASNAPLVSLAQGGQQLEQKTVALRTTRAKYLRLTWPSGEKAIQLTSVVGQPTDVLSTPERASKEVMALPDSDKPGDYVADLGGMFPVDRMKIRLPQLNAVAPIQILSRSKSGDTWSPATRTIAYRLNQNGQEIANPEIALTPRMRRHWLFRVDQQGGGIGAGSIQVRAGWIAREIVFAARGSEPFLLAYGNGKALPNALAMHTLVPGWGSESAPQISFATTGVVQTLAGEAAARQRIDMKKVGLWTALLSGVAFLGFMAWRLSKQVQSGSN